VWGLHAAGEAKGKARENLHIQKKAIFLRGSSGRRERCGRAGTVRPSQHVEKWKRREEEFRRSSNEGSEENPRTKRNVCRSLPRGKRSLCYFGEGHSMNPQRKKVLKKKYPERGCRSD